jgi:pimeloyl-ACP methyl ester carboxylesterase
VPARCRTIRGIALSAAAGGGAWVAGSWAAAIALSDALISPVGLAPGRDDRTAFLSELRRHASRVEEFEHPGDPRDPVTLVCTFATPGNAGDRATLLFLHGKGGNATEWLPDAIRALDAGYNVLVPDLRGHGRSGGRFITFGLLEKADLGNAVAASRDRFGIDAGRIGLHACSYGGSAALQFAAGNASVHALWLESPFGDAPAMARHYLHLKSGLPGWALGLTTRWALARADERVRRATGLRPDDGLAAVDPVKAAEKIHCPVALVYGKRDRLTLPSFLGRLEEALPRNTAVWEVESAGHCHHDDQPLAVETREYERRWREFFAPLNV